MLAGAALCGIAGITSLTLAMCCIFDIIGGQCELWLLGPFVLLPFGLGLGLIGRAASRTVVAKSPELAETQGCGEREEA